MHRVVITGVGAFSPIGSRWEDIEACLRSRRNAVCHIISDFANMLLSKASTASPLPPASACMGHTAPVNIGVFLA